MGGLTLKHRLMGRDGKLTTKLGEYSLVQWILFDVGVALPSSGALWLNLQITKIQVCLLTKSIHFDYKREAKSWLLKRRTLYYSLILRRASKKLIRALIKKFM